MRRRGRVLSFIIGNIYSRKDVYKILNIPKEKQGGIWNTGYATFNNDIYIFVNVNSAGRTGHDYDNRFIGNDLQWFSKNTHSLNAPTIQSMLNPKGRIYIFTRESNKNIFFTYQGIGHVKEYDDTKPVRILWKINIENEMDLLILPEEVINPEKYIEGATKQINVNVHERNSVARMKCIEYYGVSCIICGFNFEEIYGSVGKEFIHVHHLIELREINEEYEVDPIEDLRPICPNCHAIVHKRKPAYSIKEMNRIIRKKNGY